MSRPPFPRIRERERRRARADKTPGWRFVAADEDVPGENVTPDPFHPSFTHLRDLYFESDSNYSGRFTVPVLYDKSQNRIVSNESAEILRMLGTEFDDLVDDKYRGLRLYPEALQAKIEEAHGWMYDGINNGVYKSGFATTQEAYEKNVVALFESLDRAEEHLKKSEGPYYFGKELTEVDIRLCVPASPPSLSHPTNTLPSASSPSSAST